jgi:hypothetical protein
MTTTLSLPHLQIGGASFSASTYAIDSVNCSLRSKTESITCVEAENKAPSILGGVN